MSGKAGDADGKVDAEIKIQTTGATANQSCILQTLYDGLTEKPAGEHNGTTGVASATALATELSDGRYDFTGGYEAYKARPRSLVDKFWDTIRANAGLLDASYQDIRDNYVDCIAWADQRADRFAGDQDHKGDTGAFGAVAKADITCHDGTVYFDKDCKLVPQATASAAGCSVDGSLSIMWLRGTPISLIFGSVGNPLATSTIVSFPLEPGRIGAQWQWRGSKDAPVLVYDPEHKGVITSAHQLFGPWAFGGKRSASLEKGTAQSWSSGFEALAQLDYDGDGEVAGAELKPLGLWFDENRDAVSQPGEVRPIEAVGVIALRVAFERTDPETGDLISSVGYDRVVNGKVVSGPTIDWIAHGAPSARELAIGATLGASSDGAEELLALASSAATHSASAGDTSSAAALKAHELVAGAWSVHIDGDAPEEGLSGILMFNGGDDLDLSGTSFIELGANHARAAARAIRFTSLEGSIKPETDSTAALSFVVKSKGAMLENAATVDASGMSMKGSTVATKADGSRLRYAWTARRVPIAARSGSMEPAKGK
jgi:hypothetical protein